MICVLAVLIAVCVLVLAVIIDLVFGDPSPWKPWKKWYNLHLTVWLGILTKKLEPHFKSHNPKIEKLNGVFLALIVIAAITVPAFLAVWFGFLLLGYSLPVIIVYVLAAAVILKLTICIKLETDGSIAVAKAIEAGDLTEAKRYAHFSRRDPTNLTGAQIGSAVIESMVENLTDFKHSPMLYYASFGIPGAVAFRAVNTLDGMVGFKDAEHINTGWFSATLDTIVNYIPARLTTLLILAAAAILGDDYKNGWVIARRDRANVPSRNHGWQMAAIAGVLHVQLEKPGKYVVGDPVEELTASKILRALKIRDVSIVLCALLALPIFVVVGLYLPMLWGFPIWPFWLPL